MLQYDNQDCLPAGIFLLFGLQKLTDRELCSNSINPLRRLGRRVVLQPVMFGVSSTKAGVELQLG